MAEIPEKLLYLAVGGLLTALAKHLFDRKQTRRSELRERVSLIESSMRSLEASATEYWLVEHGDEKATSLEKKIKSLKKSVGFELGALRKNNFKAGRSCDVQLVAVNKAITSAPFESRPHQPEPARVEQIQDNINEFVDELRRSLSII